MTKNILVIGGSSGIGLSITKQLVAQNHRVWVASRTFPAELQSLGIQYVPIDVTQIPENFASSLPDELHGVVYCPGTINLKPFHRLTKAEFLEDFNINVMGAVQILQASFNALRKTRNASIVLFSTVASTLGMGFHSSIAVSKSAIEGLTKSLAAEWATYQIRVNAIAPSLTDTPLASKLLTNDEKREASAKRHPLGRIGTTEDMANLAVFLLSEQASWITGQIIGVDGGMGSLKP